MRKPREPRGADAPSRFKKLARALKEDSADPNLPDSGFFDFDEQFEDEQIEPILPRFVVKRPRKGFLHPATKSDIIDLLEFFGEQCFYGLDSIKLLQGTSSFAAASGSGAASILLGRLEVPGCIILYDLPESPWVINDALPDAQIEQLKAAGAEIEIFASGAQTRVSWTDENLKNFFLFDVFMHEVGHHLIQQYKGKRKVRVARTRDHEHYANLFARRCREEFLAND